MSLQKFTTFAVRARGIIPKAGQPMIEDALLIAEQGRIAEIGPFSKLRKHYQGEIKDLGNAILVPALINAHTHLELSHLHGKTARGQGFMVWVESMLQAGMDNISTAAVDAATRQLADSGTAFVIDITSRQPLTVAKALKAQNLQYKLALEYFGYEPAAGIADKTIQLPEEILKHVTGAGHALYSTSPDNLKAAKKYSNQKNQIYCLHLAEHEAEIETVRSGKGPFLELFQQAGIVPKSYKGAGISPVAKAKELNLLDEQTLAVHCVHLTDNDIEILKNSKATVCLCPRSNLFIGVGRARWEDLADANIPICLGTDGLTSNTDLNLWHEAEFILKESDSIHFDTVLDWLTAVPAKFLNKSQDLGELTPGHLACYSKIPETLIKYMD